MQFGDTSLTLKILFDYKRLCHPLTMVLLLVISLSSNARPIGHAPWFGDTFENAPCNGPGENFGPFDYLKRKQLPNELGIVERYHFSLEVEQLLKGQTNTSPLPDIGYTLRAWPNHHRALYSLIRHRISLWPKKYPARYVPAECYLQRAIKFSPQDGTVYMLYGILLHRTSHKDEALKQYEIALNIDPSNVQAKYNLGLLLVDLKQYHKAKEYAQELYSRGFPLPGLKDKLKKVGKWDKSDEEAITSKSGGIPEV